jgi:hypothetical protein
MMAVAAAAENKNSGGTAVTVRQCKVVIKGSRLKITKALRLVTAFRLIL